jgi:hypothetical protein
LYTHTRLRHDGALPNVARSTLVINRLIPSILLLRSYMAPLPYCFLCFHHVRDSARKAREKQRKQLGSGAIADVETDATNASVYRRPFSPPRSDLTSRDFLIFPHFPGIHFMKSRLIREIINLQKRSSFASEILSEHNILSCLAISHNNLGWKLRDLVD